MLLSGTRCNLSILRRDSEIEPKNANGDIEVFRVNSKKELRLKGGILPYSIYDRLSEVDQGTIVDNKRLGRTLELIKLVQDKW
ncbi:transposase [Providencia stuartii MRSN 2154]|uniref:Transposase n=1 Tax=Providencia stuartii (strain MRSN 2154) TaxID=1157951 RepID=A0A140NS28_PROSM|nr:transposase [Providencia stuartii MRSN 2154]